MNSRNRAMLIMGGVFLALVAALFFVQSAPPVPTDPTATPLASVWDYSSATPQGLMVQNVTTTLAMQVVNGKWQITAPTKADADELQVSQIAMQLKKPQANAKVGDNVTDLAQYGLDNPEITVTLVLSGVTPPEQKLFIGKSNVDGSAYFVRTGSGNAVYTVSNATIEPLRNWLTSPPIALPTPTPLAVTVLPAPEITATLTVTLPQATPATAVPAPQITATLTLPAGTPATALPQATPATAVPAGPTMAPGTVAPNGTQPAPGTSPVSSPPAAGAGASPAPSGPGGGPGSTPGVVVSPSSP